MGLANRFAVSLVALTLCATGDSSPFFPWPLFNFRIEDLFPSSPTAQTNTQFPCNDTDNTTIQENWMCDSDIDCPNDADEHVSICNKTECEEDEFECGDSGICIVSSWKCDGDSDCLDGEDELTCGSPETSGRVCKDDEFKCEDDLLCILDTWQCDGDDDCFDASDENDESCGKDLLCIDGEMACHSPIMCMPSTWICDESRDCDDGSDEANCTDAAEETETVHTCIRGHFPCVTASGPECLLLESQCDGVFDCVDSSDEGGDCSMPCGNAEDGSENTCSQKCFQTPRGPICFCDDGFRLGEDNKTCHDTNECEGSDDLCAQICVNTNGSYRCACQLGFSLHSDGRRCKAEGHDHAYLHVGLQDKIREMELLPFNPELRSNLTVIHYSEVPGVVAEPGATITDVDYLLLNETIIWLERMTSSSVIKSKSAGKDVKVLLKVEHEKAKINRISIDWVGLNVYFTVRKVNPDPDSTTCQSCGKIGLIPILGGSGNAEDSVIHGVAENLGNLMDIVVVPNKGIFLTCEYSAFGRLLGIAMDGSESWTIHRNVRWPLSLAYDDVTNHLFWAQSPPTDTDNSPTLYSVNAIEVTAQTTHPRVLISRNVPYFKTPAFISVFESRLYWYDIDRHEVLSVDALSGKNHMVIAKLTHKGETKNASFPIAITHSTTQHILKENLCLELDCEHTCVVASTNVHDMSASVELIPECICPDDRDYFKLTSSCRVKSQSTFLMTVENGVIRMIHESGREENRRLSDDFSAYSLAYDTTRHRIYYANALSQTVRYVDTRGHNHGSEMLAEDADPTRYMALDPTSGNVYWIDGCVINIAAPDAIDSGVLKGRFTKRELLSREAFCPKGLAYDIHRHKIYFLNYIRSYSLYSMNSDGSEVHRIRSVSSSEDIIHMTYDAYADRVVYVGKGPYDTVLVYSLDISKNDFLLYKASSDNVTAVAVSSDLVYTYDSWGDKLLSQRKSKVGSHGDRQVHVASFLVRDYDSPAHRGGGLVYADVNVIDLRKENHPCWTRSTDKAQCSHFCFPMPSKPERYECGCTEGYTLQDDGYTCSTSACPANTFSCYQYNITHQRSAVDTEVREFSACIPLHEVCDRRKTDCYDASDESTAVCDCEEPTFKACLPTGEDRESGVYQCIRGVYFCDGERDCINGADEMNCTCNRSNYFQCPEENTGFVPLCIPKDWVGDGDEDCLGGGDEMEISCPDGQYQCERHPNDCVSNDFLCDGNADCSDGSDEQNCPGSSVTSINVSSTNTPTTTAPVVTTTAACSAHHYQCDDGDCIEMLYWVCDGASDCSDGSDEGGNCSQACDDFPEVKRHCVSDCFETPRGPTCRCPVGYEYNFSEKQCSDANECQSGKNNCDQFCVNTDGSFKCSCDIGYLLENGYRCKATGHEPFMIVSTDSDFRLFTARAPMHYELVKMDFYGQPKPAVLKPSAFTIKGKDEFYWVERFSSSLFLTNIWNGTTIRLARHLPSVTMLAWDWAGLKLYWVNQKKIEVVTATAQYVTSLLTSDTKINGLALNPMKSVLFYSSANKASGGKISLCSMNGKNCKTFASEQNDIFRTMTVDIVDNVLYWVLHYSNKIESSTIGEVKRKTVYQAANDATITGLSVFEFRLSWIESKIPPSALDGEGVVIASYGTSVGSSHSTVYYLDKKTHDPSTKKSVRDNLPVSTGLGIVQEWSQPQPDPNFCTEGFVRCQFFCWASEMNCSCPTERLHSTSLHLLPRRGFCSNMPVCPAPLSEAGSRLVISKMSAVLGGRAEVSCPGESTIHDLVCRANGSWSISPKCAADQARCSALSIANANVIVHEFLTKKTVDGDASKRVPSDKFYSAGSTAVISCKKGYAAGNTDAINATLKCRTDGTWVGERPTCLPTTSEHILVGGDNATAAMVNKPVSTENGKQTSSENGKIIALIIVIVIMAIILIVIVVWWRRKKGLSCRKRGGFSPQKLTSARTSTSEVGNFDDNFVVSYMQTDENSYARIGGPVASSY